MPFFEWLDNTDVVVWIRDSTSVFAYPTIIALHTLSMAMLVGVSTGLALRTLGFAPGVPLAPLDRFFRLIRAGFYISLASGLPLLSTDARTFLTNPVFYVKMIAVVSAVLTVRLLRAAVFAAGAQPDRRPIQLQGKLLAGAVLLLWMVALTAGRVTAYDPFIARQTAAAVAVLCAVLLVVGVIGARMLRAPAAAARPRVAANS